MIIKVGEYIEFYYAKGYSLTEIGLSYRAFAKEDALDAVEMLKRFRVPITGGSVITLNKGRLGMSLDHWGCSKWEFDDYDVYLETSWQKAKKYIKLFKDSPDCQYLYALFLPFSIKEPTGKD